jgi:hypothetical protein
LVALLLFLPLDSDSVAVVVVVDDDDARVLEEVVTGKYQKPSPSLDFI